MRTKDDSKKAALFEATVKLVNEMGFVFSSVSKIAKEANVSPATVYVYYKNKEDLLASTYVEIKQNLSEAILQDFDSRLPVRDILEKIWFNLFEYVSNQPDYFKFAEQFSNSPYSSLVDQETLDQYYESVFNVLQRGIDEKIIKNVHFDILTAFMFYPMLALSKSGLCQDFELNDEHIETAFTLAWDAIKL